jgi:hypothetical protein
MGHSSTRAALIYQHTAQEQDRQIADALSARIERERHRARNGHGPQRKRSAQMKAQVDIWSDLGLHTERVKGIEPSLSAWEAHMTRRPQALTRRSRRTRTAWSGPYGLQVMAR